MDTDETWATVSHQDSKSATLIGSAYKTLHMKTQEKMGYSLENIMQT